MKVSIHGTPEEITALALMMQEQLIKHKKLNRDVKDLQRHLLSERKEVLDKVMKG